MRTPILILLSLTLSGCLTLPTLKKSETAVLLSAQDSNAVALLEQTKSDTSGWTQWKLYQSVEGYKAFAISADSEGNMTSTGWSEDMISQYWAVRSAMYLCRYYANYDWPCQVVDIQGPSKEVVLSQETLDSLPEQIMSFSSVRIYNKYQLADGPKAITMRMPSGRVNWTQADTVAEAQEQARKTCYEELHEVELNCEVLASEE